MLYMTRNKLSPKDAKHPEFRALSAMLVEDISETLNERLVEHAEFFVPEIEDDASWTDFRNLALVQLTSFLLQQPVSSDSVIDSRFLTYEHGREFFKDFSPAGEFDDIGELQQLRVENDRLQAENDALTIQLMRRRPTRHRNCQNRGELRFGAIEGSFSYV